MEVGPIARGPIARGPLPPPRVLLRPATPDDLPVFFEQQLDPEAHHRVAFRSRDPADRAAFDAHWAKVLADPAVRVRAVLFEGRLAGYVCAFERDGQREVAYWLGREHRGRGVATEALARLLEEEPVRPLVARVVADHAASLRVLEKCGFVACGSARAWAEARGREVEEVVLRLEGAGVA